MSLDTRKIRTVALTEYRQFVLTKTFLFLLLLSPALIVIIVAVTLVAESSRDLSSRSFYVVDRTGVLFDRLIDAAKRHNEHDIFEYVEGMPGVQREARFLPMPFQPEGRDEAALLAALSDAVRNGKVFAFVILDAEVRVTGETGGIRYYSQNQTYSALPNWLERTLNREIQNLRMTDAGIDPETVRKLTVRHSLERYGLAQMDERGELKEPEKENTALNLLLPLGAMMLLFFCANMSSPIMLNSVMEEKMQKIAEVLLAAVTPLELMAGKLAGSVMAALTLGFVYLAPSVGFLVWRGYGGALRPELLLWFPVFLLLTILSLGAVWAAIGAACSELKDTQNFAGVAILLLMIPFVLAMAILESPNTPFASVVSLLPACYPFLMTVRLSTAPGPELWELWTGLAINIVFTMGCIWAGAKIFRRGILQQGKAPTLRGLVEWLRAPD